MVVVGAGIVGLACAVELAKAGAAVRLIDAAGDAPTNASSIAAGMLAPAGEALTEGGGAAGFQLLLDARDRWPAFAESVPGLEIIRCGCDLVTSAEDEADTLRLLREGGIEFAAMGEGRISLPQDWRIDVEPALAALRRAADGLGVVRGRGRAGVGTAGRLLIDGEQPRAPVVVFAAGFESTRLGKAAPELAALSPIKGQILHLNGFAPGGALRRGPGGYVVPQAHGARIGGTMEPGLDDTSTDAAVTQRFLAMVAETRPPLSAAIATPYAGVRAATPDGCPLVGWSRSPGVLLATGARRNGWLLAPLIGATIAALWKGEDPGHHAPLFHPGRFGR